MPNGGVPFYMRMDSATVNSASLGDNGITDVWVEVNKDNIGAYELPCNYPVLAEQGTVRFVVSAGIYESGQGGVRVQYPFFEPDTFSISATAPNQYVHHPAFKYKPAAFFAAEENFEAGNGFDTNMEKVYGTSNFYGQLTVNATDSSMEAVYTTKKALPAGQEIWLEFDYKAEVPFYSGFYATYGSTNVVKYPILFVTPKNSWSKMYLKLSNYVGTVRADSYNVYFEALRPYTTAGGNVYIDNVKLVHF